MFSTQNEIKYEKYEGLLQDFCELYEVLSSWTPSLTEIYIFHEKVCSSIV